MWNPFIPVNLAIPELLGLANIVIVAVLYIFTWKEALAVSVLRSCYHRFYIRKSFLHCLRTFRNGFKRYFDGFY